jgi:hypothetical protein
MDPAHPAGAWGPDAGQGQVQLRPRIRFPVFIEQGDPLLGPGEGVVPAAGLPPVPGRPVGPGAGPGPAG